MKKFILLSVLIIFFYGCKNMLLNSYFQKIGVYDETINLDYVVANSKKIAFVPMVHIGTELFYEDVKNKIDSLQSQGYYFYYENLNSKNATDTVLRKVRKIRGLSFSKSGYMDIMDSLFISKKGFKFKKEIMNQPSYGKLGLDSLNSKNVDISLNDLINFYENKYGVIELEECDFETTVFETSACETNVDKKALHDAIVNFRNSIVVNEVVNDTRTKIAIIYGKNHFIGIKEELLKKGYTE